MKSDQFLQKDVWPSFCITGHFSLTFRVTFCFTSSLKPKHGILCLHLLWTPMLFALIVVVTLLLDLWTLSLILLGLFNGEILEGLNGLNWYRWVLAAKQNPSYLPSVHNTLAVFTTLSPPCHHHHCRWFVTTPNRLIFSRLTLLSFTSPSTTLYLTI